MTTLCNTTITFAAGLTCSLGGLALLVSNPYHPKEMNVGVGLVLAVTGVTVLVSAVCSTFKELRSPPSVQEI